MFEKNMKIAYLLDFYGDALDEHTLGVMRDYYNDDLSLAEIAVEAGISRQGVRHLIKKGEDTLLFYEEKFSLAARHGELSYAVKLLKEVYDALPDTAKYKEEKCKLYDAVNILLKGNQDVSEFD